MNPRLPKLLLYLLGGLLLLNLIQAYFTELIYDEAYYWQFAKELAWGYFDHPPMVAWMAAISGHFFDGELGVRFLSCLLSIGTMIILWMMINHPRKNDYVLHFFVLVFSMTLMNAYGFLTLPDTPLLFFTALFLWVYKKFLEKNSLARALILGILMACLMYSKYNAVLIIISILVSNPKLVINKYAWAAVGCALFFYIPHFFWLFESDFVGVKYHLFERPSYPYNFNDNTLAFLVNLLALFGFTFPFIYYALYKTKITDLFTKALVYLSYGVILFFFVSSFSRLVQTQWLVVISIPLVILVFNYMMENEKSRNWIFKLGILNIAILLFLRLGLVFEPLFPIHYESHGNKKWTSELHEKIGDTRVVFENSYRRAPMYSFYTGVETYSLNNLFYRKNQYSLDQSEGMMRHEKVFYVSEYIEKGDVEYTQSDGKILQGNYYPDFESFRKLKCIVEDEKLIPGSKDDITLKVFNPYGFDIDLKKIKFGVVYLDKYKKIIEIYDLKDLRSVRDISLLKSNEISEFTLKLPEKVFQPTYLRFGISENGLPYGLNGETQKLD
ncbi:glycosyltransferase family 39 protein [Aurantibacter crassamenti]|uniref:ArnT family glycosyltransferase n=1 Tax=Aurantibacter crassamenti TaxID=1837375 RepID=UPI0019395D28|nr:glycosyltransferase family 39 protein [Aurantibacter crassamenti]MBM1104796.1 glycosyltransferase family 39 protein [Aurantibacter crassamenti]